MAGTKKEKGAAARVAKPPRNDLTSPARRVDAQFTAAMAPLTAGISGQAMVDAWVDWALHLARSPGRQIELAHHAQANAGKVFRYAGATALGTPAEKPFAPGTHDTRWSAQGWQKPPFGIWEQSFLAVQDWWAAATQDIRGLRDQNAQRVGYLARQGLDAMSPANFPFSNPEIQDATVAGSGVNLLEGAMRFAEDMRTALRGAAAAERGPLVPGKGIAATPGAVVFRNEIMELIQYAPQTPQVHAEPVLIVPAWIMKYYVLDLSPHNSLINWLVGQGFTVFCISWRNPGAEHAGLSLESYRCDGIMTALDTIGAILPQARIHAVGYCLGGTLLAIAAATMARERDDRLASVSLLAAQVDFTEAGELLLFLDESQIALIEDMMWQKGYLERSQMSGAFAALRSEDLVWANAIRRYFLGRKDLQSDMAVWNRDSTRMPARMHSEYLRGLFHENRLTAGRFAVEGRPVALKDISAPMFVVATESDHIAPWRSVYKVALFTSCDLDFVLTNGGHNGGIVSEPGHRGRHFRSGHRKAGALYTGPDDWLEGHEARPGSWWPEWGEWLAARSGAQVPPPPTGAPDRGLPVLDAAPGRYVHLE